ncbi:hypothetical protein K435DRAFT_874191 [Dendrothele bispora CBS 962.96]|uniref:Uncharacterized protein n=1 Tax=Dendrothele bispora (strain CBS 962.96) TaxID=1314807 RepID=A0A4S8KYE2_DENBC|nr:hypothetical protein K435DRAFT_874191 [Dendrothele bispora CBS 962.96]
MAGQAASKKRSPSSLSTSPPGQPASKDRSSSSLSPSPHSPEFSKGDIVGTFLSPMEAFYNAIASTLDRSRGERSTIRSRESNPAKQGPRPAIIREIKTDGDRATEYRLSLLASFSSTPFETLHENTKDLVITVSSPGNKHQDAEHVIQTNPPWPNKIQYVVTPIVTTSAIFEWRTNGSGGKRYKVSDKDLDLLSQVSMEQALKLMVKLRTYPGGGFGWFKDLRRVAKEVARQKAPDSDLSSLRRTFSGLSPFSIRSSVSKASKLASINENEEPQNGQKRKSVLNKRRPLKEAINIPP